MNKISMKKYILLFILFIVIVFFSNKIIFAEIIIPCKLINGISTISFSSEQIRKSELQFTEAKRENYKPYECDIFKLGE